MKRFFEQWLGTLIIIALFLGVLRLMWYLAIPLLVVFLGINLMKALKHHWEKGKVPHTRYKPIRPHDVIDVEYREIKE